LALGKPPKYFFQYFGSIFTENVITIFNHKLALPSPPPFKKTHFLILRFYGFVSSTQAESLQKRYKLP
ncbi:MAG: hypothetical protein ACK53Y_01865, partial [bacterium]